MDKTEARNALKAFRKFRKIKYAADLFSGRKKMTLLRLFRLILSF